MNYWMNSEKYSCTMSYVTSGWNPFVAEEAHNRAGTAGASGVLVQGCACMYACPSVTGLQLKYMGLRIVYGM